MYDSSKIIYLSDNCQEEAINDSFFDTPITLRSRIIWEWSHQEIIVWCYCMASRFIF